MLKEIVASWKNNHGTQLLSIACLSGIIMCLLWYKQWLPEVNLIPSSNFVRRPAATGSRAYFVARVELTEQALADEILTGAVLLFTADQISQENRSPMFAIPFLVENNAATVIEQLPPGDYAALVFLDLNENGRFDIGEDGKAQEPFQLCDGSSGPELWKQPEKFTFSLRTESPYYCRLKF